MRRVILESPFAGDYAIHIHYAQRALADALFRGEAPLASHLLYPQVLRDADPIQRAQGVAAGLAWLGQAELMVVYADHGVSPGMQAAMDRAEGLNIPVEIRYIGASVPT